MLTKQEMFNRAWNGLKSQNFERCMQDNNCVYLNSRGLRCAWGWVDPENTEGMNGDVYSLQNHKIGIAVTLNRDEISFASDLQVAHDIGNINEHYTDKYGYQPLEVENNLRKLAAHHNLSIPQ